MNPFAAASGIVLCAALAIPSAHASDRILFVGSVVAPTCAPSAGLVYEGNAIIERDLRARCPHNPASTRYTLHLEPATASGVRLVEYYDGYIKASGSRRAVRLATQTYE